ncbi:hypothetical protein IFM89_017814 [Coptis chinensis]|uniref:MATH domain-containing protein n=1 Tax=Coptis chinensis TaxID=261450 RepID=A0A835H683_9MAGN|nr:hypothetical protein IFM89_017814 [Coptis chinensis]
MDEILRKTYEKDLDERATDILIYYGVIMISPLKFQVTVSSLLTIENGVGCDCEGICSRDECVCCRLKPEFDSEFGFEYEVMSECGERYVCDLSCGNRLTQKGVSVRLRVVKDGRKGWGLHAGEFIRQGEFVCDGCFGTACVVLILPKKSFQRWGNYVKAWIFVGGIAVEIPAAGCLSCQKKRLDALILCTEVCNLQQEDEEMLVPNSDLVVEGPQPMEVAAQVEAANKVENNQPIEDPPSSRFTWTIENFNRINTKKHYSDVFVVGGFKWCVLIFPKGNNVDQLSMYLDVADSPSLPYGWSRYAQFSLSVVNQVYGNNRYFHSTIINSKAQAATAPIPRAVPLSRMTDSFLDGSSSVYLEELQRAWEDDPSSVDESWDNFFRNFVGQAATSPGISGQTIQESMRLLLLERAYQVNGHMKAKLDPLGLEERVIPENPKLVQDLMNQILHADYPMFDNGIVCQSNSLLVQLSIPPLASKKIVDAKLAKDFQAVLKEFQKAQRLAVERETTYYVSQVLPPSRDWEACRISLERRRKMKRARELFYYLKGGQVDYVEFHILCYLISIQGTNLSGMKTILFILLDIWQEPKWLECFSKCWPTWGSNAILRRYEEDESVRAVASTVIVRRYGHGLELNL